ncbi:MAG: alpha/beta hydrolase [Bdellovibrionaceae bacterium]|nr:alpha/beta hydrolase [Pseudobdellovibrionaceae bacterium]
MDSSKPRYEFVERMTPTPWGRVFSRHTHDARNPRADVILVPGMIISSSYMIPLSLELAAYCPVHMIDFPGYGRSEKPSRTLNIIELAEVLHVWMRANQLEKASLVANSFGCQIAAEFAVRYPEAVNRLVLQGPTVDPEARNVITQAIRLKRNSWRETKPVGMISAHDYRSAGVSRVLKTIHMVMHDRIETKLPLIRAKTLVVRGSLDTVVPQRWAERATELLPHAELCVIEGAAHTLNYSEPAKFAQAIRGFLELDPRPSREISTSAWPSSHPMSEVHRE